MTLVATYKPETSPSKFRLLLKIVLLTLAVPLACSLLWMLSSNLGQPKSQAGLLVHTAYAYRQWQSTGFYLKPGDWLRLKASGQWLYSPEVGWHGPEGGLPAPAHYPYPAALGGALLGRIGESGIPFYLGRETTYIANETGLLYVQINDDRLGDNAGKIVLEIAVTPAQDGS